MKPLNRENSWKWGIIYYNPDDPLIFVKKREESLGLTFNFAHWQSLVLTLSILAAIVASVWLLG